MLIFNSQFAGVDPMLAVLKWLLQHFIFQLKVTSKLFKVHVEISFGIRQYSYFLRMALQFCLYQI